MGRGLERTRPSWGDNRYGGVDGGGGGSRGNGGSSGGNGSREDGAAGNGGYGAAAGTLAWEAARDPIVPTPSPRTLAPAGAAGVGVSIGTIAFYDEATGTALAVLIGSPDRLVGPLAVTACLPRDAKIVGAACLVVEIDPYNPADGVVAALWGTGGGAGDPTLNAALTQAGRETATILAGATGAAVAVVFARPYTVAPVVVASTSLLGWTAAITATTQGGCTLSVSGGTSGGAGVTMEVSWIAVG